MPRISCRDISAFSCLLGILICATAIWTLAKADKIKPEELVARHLASLGTEAARAAVHNRTVTGNTGIVFRLGGRGQAEGRGAIVSEGRQVRLHMPFSALEYPGEILVCNGSDADSGQVSAGVRSRLSDFLHNHKLIMTEGLLGGTLSTAWPLLDLAARHPKLEYDGLKKQEGRELHELRYRAARGAGDTSVWLYFDPATYRHVQTRYKLVVGPQMPASYDQSPKMTESTYTLVESFDNFEIVDGITLPRAYKLSLTVNQQTSTFLADWTLAVGTITHNQQLDPKMFSLPGKDLEASGAEGQHNQAPSSLLIRPESVLYAFCR